MSIRELSSLDRFLVKRAPVLAGYLGFSHRYRVLSILSGVYGGLASVLLLSSLAAAGNDAAHLALLIQGGMWAAFTGVMLGAREIVKRRAKPEDAVQVRLSPEALELVQMLITHLHGWGFGAGGRGPMGLRRSPQRIAIVGGSRREARSLLPFSHDRRSEDVLSPEAFALLERAAREYNRVFAALSIERPAQHSALERLAPSIRAAIDEAMAEVLHTAAMVEKYPEGAPRLIAQATERTEELRELAEQVEQLQVEDSPSALGEATSRVRSVLGEIRAEQAIQQELQGELRTELPSATPSTAAPAEEPQVLRRSG